MPRARRPPPAPLHPPPPPPRESLAPRRPRRDTHRIGCPLQKSAFSRVGEVFFCWFFVSGKAAARRPKGESERAAAVSTTNQIHGANAPAPPAPQNETKRRQHTISAAPPQRSFLGRFLSRARRTPAHTHRSCPLLSSARAPPPRSSSLSQTADKWRATTQTRAFPCLLCVACAPDAPRRPCQRGFLLTTLV